MIPLQKRSTVIIAAIASALFLVVATLAALLFGASSVGLEDVIALLFGGEVSEATANILLNVRFPRVAAALLAGAALAVSGALIQAVLDNPLASPNIIGVNSGAGCTVLLVGSLLPGFAFLLPFAAFGGALLAALIIFAIAYSANFSRLTVVLAGIALSTVFGAGMNAILILDPDAYTAAGTFLVGGFAGSLSTKILWPSVFIVVGLVGALFCTKRLNILSLGDATAHSLGMRVNLNRLVILALAALLAGAAVSFAGLLGFVGLIVPHLVRFLVGHDNRAVVPLSAIVGSGFLVACDLLSRIIFAPYELPVGILMAFLGGPFFIFLILKNRRVAHD